MCAAFVLALLLSGFSEWSKRAFGSPGGGSPRSRWRSWR